MNSGFGRRIVTSESRDLTLISDTPDESGLGLRADFGRVELKEKIRDELMKRIDPAAAAKVSRRHLQAQIAILISEIATEHKVQLNELEEAGLAAELTDDMIGLGPLEPLLQDDTVTDILATDPSMSLSSGTVSSKRHKRGFGILNTLSISRSGLPRRSAVASMKPAVSRMAVASTSFSHRWS